MSPTTVRSRRYRARVAPRAGTRGGRSRVQWDRVGRIALVLVLFAVVISYIKPVTNLFDTWRDAGAAKQRLTDLRAENKRLERRAEDLKTPAATLREARKLGLVGPGEQAYVVKGLK